ncbi:MAG: CatB-related O-acetyltransferase [Spirochaetaceae bacterium]|nr:CatB-related O-acetyltransferase [Spirochaetaceae bacterium]
MDFFLPIELMLHTGSLPWSSFLDMVKREYVELYWSCNRRGLIVSRETVFKECFVEHQEPNPEEVFPVPHNRTVTYIKSTITRKNIFVGDFTYFSDVDFESHVTHHYDFYDDKLIIGKFCQIAQGVEFIMNGANHQMNGVSTFPFYIFEGWGASVPPLEVFPLKGDTVIGNDVWIGQNVTILPGVHIGDGAIIGAHSVVGSPIEPYTIAAGNPAKCIRKRFDEVLIERLLRLRWWDLPVAEINDLIPLLNNPQIEAVKKALLQRGL